MAPEIKKLKELNYVGWDGYCAPPITDTLIAKAEELWEKMIPIQPCKPLVTSSACVIWFEWVVIPFDKELSITIHEYSAGELFFSYYLYDKTKGIEIEKEVKSIDEVLDFAANHKIESID